MQQNHKLQPPDWPNSWISAWRSTQTHHCKLHNGCCGTLLVGCITLYTTAFTTAPVNAFQAWEDLKRLDSSFQCKNSFCHQLRLRTAGESLFISCKREENCLCSVIFFKKVLWVSSFESKSAWRHLRLVRQNSKYSFWYRKYLAYLNGTKHIFFAAETEKQAQFLLAFYPHMVIFSSVI